MESAWTSDSSQTQESAAEAKRRSPAFDLSRRSKPTPSMAAATRSRRRTDRSSALHLIAPHRLFRPAELSEFGGPERRLAGRKEFVELRRLDGRAGQHRMRLPAMVDIVLEQMHQQPVATLGLDPVLAMDLDDAVQPLGRERVAEADQAPVDRGLRVAQAGDIREWNGIAPRARPQRPALHRIDVKQIDHVNVVQGLLQTRKE